MAVRAVLSPGQVGHRPVAAELAVGEGEDVEDDPPAPGAVADRPGVVEAFAVQVVGGPSAGLCADPGPGVLGRPVQQYEAGQVAGHDEGLGVHGHDRAGGASVGNHPAPAENASSFRTRSWSAEGRDGRGRLQVAAIHAPVSGGT